MNDPGSTRRAEDGDLARALLYRLAFGFASRMSGSDPFRARFGPSLTTGTFGTAVGLVASEFVRLYGCGDGADKKTVLLAVEDLLRGREPRW